MEMTFPASDPPEKHVITFLARAKSGAGSHLSFLCTVGAHEKGADPVLQVRDLIELLVRGGVAGQFP